MNNMNNNFSENLKKIRKENNLSQEQLAEELGVSRQSISKWESAIAYPEMDKILTICNKFNLNIDDLLHKDIREVKKENEAKKSLNKYINDFLTFITNTIEMFSNMSITSKIKCLLEQLLIILILIITLNITKTIIKSLFLEPLSYLPTKILIVINFTSNLIYTIISLTISLIILIHIFKTRYLNYYEESKKEPTTNQPTFQTSTNKVIIRDPINSDYPFINGLLKILVFIIKFFALVLLSILFIIQIGIVIALTTTFLIYKTGLLFIGLLILLISLTLFNIDLILIVLNFLFNRKNDKKKIIWTLIISIITIGVGTGLITIGFLNFEYQTEDPTSLITDEIEFKMDDTLFFETVYNQDNIEYIETSNPTIKVEYQINNYSTLDYSLHSTGKIQFWTECNDPIKLANIIIKNTNAKKLIPITNDIASLKIYTTEENIEKLKNNKSKYYEELKNQSTIIENYETKIAELEEEITNLEDKIYELSE